MSNYNHSNLPLTTNNMRYVYNDYGERIKKENTDSLSTEYYLRDYLGRELAIYDYETNKPKEVNIFGNGLIGKIELTDSTDNRYYYLKDHLGSVRSVLDNNGSVVSAQDYYPYGELLRSYNASRYLFTEKEPANKMAGKRDVESSNDYGVYPAICGGARYYNSKLGVWLQVDPLSEKYPGWSSYAYTLNNPMRFVDPKGMNSEDGYSNEFDALYDHLASGGEGFPGNKGNKQATVPGNERNKIDQPTALEIINQLGKEFQDAFRKSGQSATEFLAEASEKYSSITNAAGVTSLLTPGLEEFTPILFTASKISGGISFGSQLINAAFGGNSYSKEDIALYLTQLISLRGIKAAKASETAIQIVDYIFNLFNIGNDISNSLRK
ncbi:MAG: RHS repeat-associated core domain-containing protein [Bacteroidota bacterium]